MFQKRFRQMSLTESFSKVKGPSYRFPKPTIVSVIHCIDDSDSEVETLLSESNDKPGTSKVKNCVDTSDSPCSVGSASSDQTVIYEPSSGGNASTKNNNTCDPNNVVSVKPQSDDGSLLHSTEKSSEKRPTKSPVKRKLFDENSSDKITNNSNKETNSKLIKLTKTVLVDKENSDEHPNAVEEKNKSAGGSVMSLSNINIIENKILLEAVATTSAIPRKNLTEPSTSNDISTSAVKQPFHNQSAASKTPEKHVKTTVTKKKQFMDQQQPSTSKTPESSSGGSPNRRSGSSSNDNPKKYKELKSLKAKDGKRLQIQQLKVLSELFKEVTSNIHLKNILNEVELDKLELFEKMQDDQKYCVMNLFIWKKLWYNIFKFRSKAQLYTGDDDKIICNIFEHLQSKNFVRTDYKTSEDLLKLIDQLDVKDLQEITKELRIVSSNVKKRQNLIDAILTTIRKQSTITGKSLEGRVRDQIEKKLGFAVKISDDIYQAFFHAYTLATFTNQTFIDIQKFFRLSNETTFPQTNLENYPVFYSRENFELYAKALKSRKELDDILGNRATPNKIADIYSIGDDAYNNLISLNQDDCSEHTEAPHLRRFSGRYVYCSVLSTCCKHMYTKYRGKPNEVKKWLEYLIEQFPDSGKLGDWYCKLIRLHMAHLDVINYENAAKMLIHVLQTKNDCLSESVKLELANLARQLKSSKKYKIQQLYHDQIARLTPNSITDDFPKTRIDSHCIRTGAKGRKRTYIKKGDQEMIAMSVEDVALQHYSESGFPVGKHCEGSLIKALLMLYFWDIIYVPEKVIAGTFISRLQIAPLDMFTRYFYENRKDAIDRRLLEIDSKWSDKDVLKFASENWSKHSYEQNQFGTIESTIPDILMVEVLVTVIGRKVMAKVFERLIKDLKENSSGMPDLLVWNLDQKTHKFVEVKGEGDRLAPNQLLWLDYLRKAGASIEVCLVHSIGSKRKKVKNTEEENLNSGKNKNAMDSNSKTVD